MKHPVHTYRKPLRHFFGPLLLAVFALAGCQDGLVGQEAAEQEAFTKAPREGKLRHAHLLQRQGEDGANKVMERYAELVTQTEFVVGLTSSGALSMSAVLERYSSQAGITIKRTYDRVFPGFAAHVDLLNVPAFLNQIELDNDIAWAEPDAQINRGNPSATDLKAGNGQHLPWGIDLIEADSSYTQSGNGNGSVSGVEVYVLDSGVKEHDINVVEDRSFVGGNANDAVGHGTHVAGTIAAEDDNDIVVGVAPGVRVHNFKVLDNNGQTDLSTVIAAVEEISKRKAASPATPIVVNVSFGGYVGTSDYNALDEAIAASIAQGVVYVIAAGNDAADAALVTPAHVTEALTVGAYTMNAKFASFSNYGQMVDLLAPGVDVVSASNATGAKQPPVKMTGTSMAAPHVAGAAALYLSQNPGASPQQVHDALVDNGCTMVTNAPSGTTAKSVWLTDWCPFNNSESVGGQGGKGKK